MRKNLLFSIVAAVGILAVGCGESTTSEFTATAVPTTTASAAPTVVVTFAPYTSIVEDLVGESANVVTLIPNGADPHDFEPSAADVATLNDAELIVSSGLGLEEGLGDAIGQAVADGAELYVFADNVSLQASVAGHEHGHSHEGDADVKKEDDHSDGGDASDPHLWLAPVTVAEGVDELAVALSKVTGTTVSATTVLNDLQALDADLRKILDAVPQADRVLVAGHDSLGYFAQSYGFVFVGSLVPGFSSASDVSAADVSTLVDEINEFGATAIFSEEGTPSDVADALARETGVKVVELRTHSVPDGGYDQFMTDLATTIAATLSA